MKVNSLISILVIAVAVLTSCGSTPPAGFASIGPLKRAGGLLPPSTALGRPALVDHVDGVPHQGISRVRLTPGQHTIGCYAANFDTGKMVHATLPLSAVAGVGYAVKCRSAGPQVEFQICDNRSPDVPISRSFDTATIPKGPKRDIDLLMAPIIRGLTDDR